MENELRIYRIVANLKSMGSKSVKTTGLIATDSTADVRTLRKRVKERVERLYTDGSVEFEIKEMKKIKSDFFLAM